MKLLLKKLVGEHRMTEELTTALTEVEATLKPASPPCSLNIFGWLHANLCQTLPHWKTTLLTSIQSVCLKQDLSPQMLESSELTDSRHVAVVAHHLSTDFAATSQVARYATQHLWE